jgi:uncharacterized protein
VPLDIIPVVLGLFVGLILATTGAGGAILSIPLLVFFLNLSITQAAPIGLFALALSAGVGALLGLKAGIVRYKAAALMAVIGIMTAPVGVWLSHALPINFVGILFAGVLAYVAWRMLHETYSESTNIEAAPCQINPATSKLFWTAPCTARLGTAGSLAGVLSGLLGVGGGFVIVPALRKVSNLELQTIIATSLAVIALISTSSLLTYIWHFAIDWKIALPFGLSTLAGMLIGRLFSTKITAKNSRQAFAMLALIVAIMLAIKYLKLIIQ